jgi:hypothetical protein
VENLITFVEIIYNNFSHIQIVFMCHTTLAIQSDNLQQKGIWISMDPNLDYLHEGYKENGLIPCN